MNCERCGNEMADNALICPHCGTATSVAKAYTQSPQQTHYGPSSQQVPPYQQGYAPQPGPPPVRQSGYSYAAPPQPQMPVYTPMPGSYPAGGLTISQKNNGALIAELILSLFGVYGVGWLMAGETTVGAILLICSFFLYWPFVILGTIFTLGFGLICIGPLAIGAIAVNVILLNSTLDRKATQFVVVPPQAPMPPQY